MPEVKSVLRLKILTLGEVRVGKSSLVRRYRWEYHCTVPSINCKHPEDEFSKRYEETLGVDFYDALKPQMRVEDGQQVRVVASFFDMSGDINFLKVRSEFYQDYSGVLLVFDVTSKQSFERLEIWLNEASKFGGKPITKCIVCGNKSDSNEREVSPRDGRQWATSKGFQYFETSAQSGQGVVKAIDALIESCQGARQSSYKPPAGPQRQQTDAGGMTNPKEMAVKHMKKELDRFNVTYADCLEKADYVKRLNEARSKRQQHQTEQSRRAAERRKSEAREAEVVRGQNLVKDQVLKEVEKWIRGKDIRAMLNTLLQYSSNDPSFLDRHCDFGRVKKAYRQVVKIIHPDKVDSGDFQAHFKATELFKAVNEAFEAFKKMNENRVQTLEGSSDSSWRAAPPGRRRSSQTHGRRR